MRYFTIGLALAVMSVTACSTGAENTDKVAETPTLTAPAASSPPIAATNVITDPVCGMEKDTTWTDYTMYKADTVWFCAAAEKTAFLGNPAKYEKNLPHH